MQNLRRRISIPGLLSVLLLVAACAPKIPRSYVVLVPDPDGAVGEVVVSGSKGQQVLTQAGQVAGIDGNAVKATLAESQLKADFSEAKAAQPAAPDHFMLYFQFGSSRLTPDSEIQFNEILNRVKSRAENGAVELVVIGHTDTVGSTEDNIALSAQRAKTVVDRLQASGAKFSSLTTESHGKSNPLVPTKDGVAEPRNRRVQVTIR